MTGRPHLVPALAHAALAAALVGVTLGVSLPATGNMVGFDPVFALVVALSVLPFALLGAFAAVRWVRLAPFPLVAAALGKGAPPPRWRLVPAVAVAGGVFVFVASVPVIIAAAPLFEGATLDAHPFARIDGPSLLLANLQVVAEEVVFRLVLLFPLAALFGVRAADRSGRPSRRAWAAIVVSGVLFGLAHAPDAAALGVDAAGYAVYAVVQKGLIGGVAFGYVAWRWGLEASILTHYAANLFAIAVSLLAQGA